MLWKFRTRPSRLDPATNCPMIRQTFGHHLGKREWPASSSRSARNPGTRSSSLGRWARTTRRSDTTSASLGKTGSSRPREIGTGRCTSYPALWSPRGGRVPNGGVRGIPLSQSAIRLEVRDPVRSSRQSTIGRLSQEVQHLDEGVGQEPLALEVRPVGNRLG